MSGRAHDLWIWKLWHGILDADAQPPAAIGLLLAWGLATLGCAILLARSAHTNETLR